MEQTHAAHTHPHTQPLIPLQRAVQAELNAYAEASPEDRHHTASLERMTDDLRVTSDAFEARRLSIQTDARLSPEGKREKLNAAREELQNSIQKTMREAADTTEHVGKRAAYKPPTLETDRTLQEARLQSARADARMILDGAQDNSIADTMRDLVESSGDAAIQHLLLNTNWADMYMRARGVRDSQSALWDQYRARLMDVHLPPEALATYRRQTAYQKHLQKANMIIQHAGQFVLRDWGAR